MRSNVHVHMTYQIGMADVKTLMSKVQIQCTEMKENTPLNVRWSHFRASLFPGTLKHIIIQKLKITSYRKHLTWKCNTTIKPWCSSTMVFIRDLSRMCGSKAMRSYTSDVEGQGLGGGPGLQTLPPEPWSTFATFCGLCRCLQTPHTLGISIGPL